MGQGILEFPKIRHCGIPSLREFRHCEGAKRPKQSHQIAVIAREQSDRSNLIKSPSLRGFEKAEAISFKKFRHSHLLSLKLDCFVVRFTHSSQ